MPNKKCLLLSTVFSRYQILSNKIIQTYINKTLKKIDPNENWVIQNIIENTPYGMYKNNALQSYGSLPLAIAAGWWVNGDGCTQWGFKNPSGISHGSYPMSSLWCVPTFLKNSQEQVSQPITLVLCIIAFACSLYYLIYNCDLLFVVGNGPVVNSGFASLIGMARTLGVRVIYWKDDVRHLWGFSDNPAMIGSLEDVHSMLYNIGDPFQGDGMLTRIYKYQDSKTQTSQNQHCGLSYFDQIIKNSLLIPDQKVDITNISQSLQNLIQLGGLIQKQNIAHNIPPANDKLKNSYWITNFNNTFPASMENSIETFGFTQWRLFCNIAAVIIQNRNLISSGDRKWLEEKLTNLPSLNNNNIDNGLYDFNNKTKFNNF